MIKTCEEILINSNPSISERMENGFFIRFLSNQYPCIIYALHDKKNSLSQRIKYNEKLLKQKGQNPSYRILYTDEYRILDEELFKHGYEKICEGNVKYMDINKIQKELFTFASFIENGVFIEPKLEKFWMEQYRRFKGMEEYQTEIFVDNMRRTEEEFYYFTLMKEGKIIGQAYGGIDHGIFVICDVVIDPKYEGLSYDNRLIMSMLSYAYKNEIKLVIMAVEDEEESTIELLHKIGFKDGYRFWQRMKKIVDN